MTGQHASFVFCCLDSLVVACCLLSFVGGADSALSAKRLYLPGNEHAILSRALPRYNDRCCRQFCAFSTSSLIRWIFSRAERRGSSHAMAIFFRCSTRLAFAIVASPDLSATICSQLRPVQYGSTPQRVNFSDAILVHSGLSSDPPSSWSLTIRASKPAAPWGQKPSGEKVGFAPGAPAHRPCLAGKRGGDS